MLGAISRRERWPGICPDARGGPAPDAAELTMKTSDLHIAEGGGNGAGSTLRALFNLDWLSRSKAKRKRASSRPGPSPRAAASPIRRPKLNQSAADVLKLLRTDGARRIGVFGDRGFADLMAAQGADLSQVWISTDFVSDIPAGAQRLGREVLGGLDAIVVGGVDIATASASRCARSGLTRRNCRCIGSPTIGSSAAARRPFRSRSTIWTRWSSTTSKNTSASRTICSSASK